MISIQQDVDLTPLNTLRVSVAAKYFTAVKSKRRLREILSKRDIDYPVFVLGGGSNVLFVKDFQGLVIQPDIIGKKIIDEDKEHVWLKAGAGENWHDLVRFCVKKGWGGIENLSLIPGRAGAAPIQNIGAYGVEFEEVFHSLTAIEIATGRERKFYEGDCNFGYRDSIFKQRLKNKFVITDVTMKLDKFPELNTSYGSLQQELNKKGIKNPSIKDISEAVVEIRNSKLPDPAEIANAGSFFKNPAIDNAVFRELKKEFPHIPGYAIDGNQTKVPAGWLIEKTGWKGKVKGNVGTFRQQALVIVNKGGASGREILSLAKEIQQSVIQKFGIALVPEVNIIGTEVELEI